MYSQPLRDAIADANADLVRRRAVDDPRDDHAAVLMRLRLDLESRVTRDDLVVRAHPGHERLHYFEFDRLIFFAARDPVRTAQQRQLAALLLQPEVSGRLQVSAWGTSSGSASG